MSDKKKGVKLITVWTREACFSGLAAVGQLPGELTVLYGDSLYKIDMVSGRRQYGNLFRRAFNPARHGICLDSWCNIP